jgi:hypothetical protein
MRSIVLAIFLFLSQSVVALEGIVPSEVIAVYDGSTIVFRISGEPVTVVLNGIYVPRELSTCENDADAHREYHLAKRAVSIIKRYIAHSRIIVIKNFKRTDQFWMSGDVYVDGVNLAYRLKLNQLAVDKSKAKDTNYWCRN